MRTLVRFTIPTQEANPLVKDGSIGQTMESLMGNLQPEAAYARRVYRDQHGGRIRRSYQARTFVAGTGCDDRTLSGCDRR